MAPIYKKITLEWNGTEYNVTPTYAMIQEIEQTISLGHLLNRVIQERAPASQLADLLSAVLRAAGCKDKDASAEAINAEMYNPDNYMRLQVTSTGILLALLPETLTQGNPPPPETGEGQSQSSGGGSTTKSQSDTSESNPASSGQ